MSPQRVQAFLTRVHAVRANSMRAVVVDEADQLLGGGYERDCRRVLDTLREGDRARKAGAVCAELRLAPEAFQELPRHLRRAAYEGAPLLPVSQHPRQGAEQCWRVAGGWPGAARL